MRDEHTACIGRTNHLIRKPASNADFLVSVLPKVLTNYQNTAVNPLLLIDLVETHFGQEINYQAAHKSLEALAGTTIAHEREGFHQMGAYFDCLKHADPAGEFHLQVSTARTGRKFQKCFIAPSSSGKMFRLCPKYICLDGASTM